MAVTALLVLAGRLRAVPTPPDPDGRAAAPSGAGDLAVLSTTAVLLVLVAAPLLTLVLGSLAWAAGTARPGLGNTAR